MRGQESADKPSAIGMETSAESNLEHAGMELRFRLRTSSVTEGGHQDPARFVGLDDRIDPAAGGTVAHVGLLDVVAFHFLAQGVELRGRTISHAASENIIDHIA